MQMLTLDTGNGGERSETQRMMEELETKFASEIRIIKDRMETHVYCLSKGKNIPIGSTAHDIRDSVKKMYDYYLQNARTQDASDQKSLESLRLFLKQFYFDMDEAVTDWVKNACKPEPYSKNFRRIVKKYAWLATSPFNYEEMKEQGESVPMLAQKNVSSTFFS